MAWTLLLLTAVLMVLARMRASGGRISRRLVQIALAGPPVALIVAGLLSWSHDRTRLNVQFVGYRIPQSQMRPCTAAPDVVSPAGSGVWIGGGQRWSGDRSLDHISLPGYRGHLVEICSGADGTAGVRAARPGEQFNFVSRPTLSRTNDIDTQVVQLRDDESAIRRECVRIGSALVPLQELVAFAETQQDTDLRTYDATRGVRSRILGALRTFGSGNEVFCIDATSATPQRCATDMRRTPNPLFLWREGSGVSRRWNALASDGAEWCECSGANGRDATQSLTIEAAELPSQGTWEEWKRTADRVRVRMVTRRSVSGIADHNVPLPLDRFDVAPLRLGRPYDFRIGRLANRSLIVISEEPSVQLRMADLYGPVAPQVEDGVFHLLFDTPSGDELLSIDLSSSADHLLPKAIFENVRARVSVPLSGDTLTIRVAGLPPEKHAFGEVFSLDARALSQNVSPLLVIQRITPPLATFLLPLIASILLLAMSNMERRGDPMISAQWTLVPILMAFLVVRFGLSTRLLLDEYASSEALHVWIENGAWLFLGPLLLIAAPVLLHRAGRAARVSQTAALYETEDTPQAHRVADFRRGVAAWWKHLVARENAPVTEWAVIAVFSTLTWIAVTAPGMRSALDVALKIFATVAIAVIAAAMAWITTVALEKRSAFEASATNGDLFSTKPKKRWHFGMHSVPLKALLVGVAYLVARGLMTLPFGSQEQLPGNIRVDVLSIPLAAALLAAFSRPNESSRAQRRRFVALLIICFFCFMAVGAVFNDFGLLWLGGMAVFLALPAACGDRLYAYIFSAAIFIAGFVSPIFAPKPFRELLRVTVGRTQEIATTGDSIRFQDDLQVARSRDYYRLLDGNRPDDVEAIPSQLAREVVVERERVRYQSLDGAWRESFRATEPSPSAWLGAGFLRGRPIIGDPTFRRAAQSDYIYPTYLRAEFGTLGMLSVLGLYVALFVVGAFPAVDRGRATLALWASALGVGTALFMLGGTARLFPFSGKWPLLMSFASDSDIALALALLMLITVERD
jgi:hypothetical protein